MPLNTRNQDLQAAMALLWSNYDSAKKFLASALTTPETAADIVANGAFLQAIYGWDQDNPLVSSRAKTHARNLADIVDYYGFGDTALTKWINDKFGKSHPNLAAIIANLATMTAIAANREALTALLLGSTSRIALFASAPAMAIVAASSTAQTLINNNADELQTAVFNNPTALAAYTSDASAMDTLLANVTNRDKIFANAAWRSAILSSPIASVRLCLNGAALTKVLTDATMRGELITNEISMRSLMNNRTAWGKIVANAAYTDDVLTRPAARAMFLQHRAALDDYFAGSYYTRHIAAVVCYQDFYASATAMQAWCASTRAWSYLVGLWSSDGGTTAQTTYWDATLLNSETAMTQMFASKTATAAALEVTQIYTWMAAKTNNCLPLLTANTANSFTALTENAAAWNAISVKAKFTDALTQNSSAIDLLLSTAKWPAVVSNNITFANAFWTFGGVVNRVVDNWDVLCSKLLTGATNALRAFNQTGGAAAFDRLVAKNKIVEFLIGASEVGYLLAKKFAGATSIASYWTMQSLANAFNTANNVNTIFNTVTDDGRAMFRFFMLNPRLLNYLLKQSTNQLNYLASSALNAETFAEVLAICAANPDLFRRMPVAAFTSTATTINYHNIATNAWSTTRTVQAGIYFVKKLAASTTAAKYLYAYGNSGTAGLVDNSAATAVGDVQEINKFVLNSPGAYRLTIGEWPEQGCELGEAFAAI